MDIPKEVREHLESAILKAFPEEIVAEIHVESVTADTETNEITITLSVSTTVDPTEFAMSYFGLTGRCAVR